MTNVERDLLRQFAEDAFEVFNWARREGFKRDKQIDEVAKAFTKRLQNTLLLEEVNSPEVLVQVSEATGLSVPQIRQTKLRDLIALLENSTDG